MKSEVWPSILGPSRTSGLGLAGELAGPRDRTQALSCGDPDPSPWGLTGWAQFLKQQRTSRPTPTSISAIRWRRSLGSRFLPTARSPGATLRGLGEVPPSCGECRTFERRAWRGEKNGGHSNAAKWPIGPSRWRVYVVGSWPALWPWSRADAGPGVIPLPHLDEISPFTDNDGQRP